MISGDKYSLLTLATAKSLLEVAVNDRGAAYVDPNSAKNGESGACKYANEQGDGPDCGVGYVLHAHGWYVEDLQDLDNANDYVGLSASQLYSHYPSMVEVEAADLLGRFQNAQDDGCSWGCAQQFALHPDRRYDDMMDVVHHESCPKH